MSKKLKSENSTMKGVQEIKEIKEWVLNKQGWTDLGKDQKKESQLEINMKDKLD